MPEDVSPHWRRVSWCFGLEFSSLQDVRDTFLWFVNYAAHTHRSAIIREASSCNRWELTQTLTTGQCIERQTLEHTVLHGISSLNPSSKLRGLCGRGRKILRVRGGYDCKETVSFRHNRTYELTETVASCTNLCRLKTDRIPTLKRKRGHKVPPQSRSCLQLIPDGK